MKELIEMYCMGGWTKKERREFWLSFSITVAFCVLAYAAIVMFAAIQG